MSMIPKHLMSEEDIKLQFITPAVTAKWDISNGNFSGHQSYAVFLCLLCKQNGAKT